MTRLAASRHAQGFQDIARRQGWGTAKDVLSVDEQRQAEAAKAAAALTRLLGQSDNGDRKTHVTPWLLIRYVASDLGYRPIPSGQVFWESPDIWVESEDPLGNPVAGKPNYVHVRILNLGAFAATPVKVDFWWGDPSVGLDAAHMHPLIIDPAVPVTTEYVQIPSLQSLDIRCHYPWVPDYLNQGHECLMVNCTNWIADPIYQPFQPVLDRHVGQRNVHVVQAPAGMLVKTGLHLANLFAARVSLDVVATITQLAVKEPLLQAVSTRELLAQVLAFDGQTERAGGIVPVRRQQDAPFLEASFNGPSRYYALCKTETQTAAAPVLAAARMRALPSSRACQLPLLGTTLRPGERRPIQVRLGVPPSARPGEYIVCRLHQVVRQTTVGGYTIVVMVTS